MTRAELAALVGAMTKPEWTLGRYGNINGGEVQHFKNGSGTQQIALALNNDSVDPDEKHANAAGIVALRNHAEKLLAVCEAAERVDGFLDRACVWGPEIDKLRAKLRDLEGA